MWWELRFAKHFETRGQRAIEAKLGPPRWFSVERSGFFNDSLCGLWPSDSYALYIFLLKTLGS